ncbi:hypothetical protein D0Z03_000918 [Geotrichum reessii]|nr:hypothetical protein D0Z03_000918 [Galactomyces reessii]
MSMFESPVTSHTTLSDVPFLSLDNAPKPRKSLPLTSLPRDILTSILQEVILYESNGSPSTYYSAINSFSKLLTTCSIFYDVGIPILYKHVAFSDNRSFDRFFTSIETTGYGNLVRTIDFSGYTPVQRRQTTPALTADSLSHLLTLCPNVNEFLSTEYIDKDLNAQVMQKLFSLPYLIAADFTGSTHTNFVEALAYTAAASTSSFQQVTRLSLHGCTSIPPETLNALLQKLPNLTRLDLTQTQIQSLEIIQPSTRLTHISLSKCQNLLSSDVKQFLSHQPYLQWLNLMNLANVKQQDLTDVLKSLPSVKYLNLHNLPVNLVPGIIKTDKLESLFLGAAPISIATLKDTLPTMPKLQYLDLSGNPNINIWTAQDTSLLNCNPEIKMIELSSDLLAKLNGIAVPGFSAAHGQGSRGWLIRGPKVPVTNTLNYSTHSGPSAISGPTVGTSISSPDHKRATLFAYAKTNSGSALSPPLSPFSMSGRSPKTHLECRSHTISNLSRPVTVLGMDMGSPAWTHASRKLNVCFIGIGGNMTFDACKERGIYLYYGYRR